MGPPKAMVRLQERRERLNYLLMQLEYAIFEPQLTNEEFKKVPKRAFRAFARPVWAWALPWSSMGFYKISMAIP